MYVESILNELQQDHSKIEVEKIDIATNFTRFKNTVCRMFLALMINNKIKGWTIPNRKEIIEFVEKELINN